MNADKLEARLQATELALDALLAEIDELRDRLAEHDGCCGGPRDEIRLS